MAELSFRMELNSQKQFTVVLLLVILNCSQRRGGHCRKWKKLKWPQIYCDSFETKLTYSILEWNGILKNSSLWYCC